MKLQQLQCLHEVVKQGMNMSLAATTLFTSQPGISKHLRDLEDELGLQLFRRSGKRLIGLSEPGAKVLQVVENVLAEIHAIKQISIEYHENSGNTLMIAATRHAASHRLLPILNKYYLLQPKIALEVQEDEPVKIAKLLAAGETDIGILSDLPDMRSDLVYFPLDSWNLVLLIKKVHPLAQLEQVECKDLIKYPLSTYARGTTSRNVIEKTFKKYNLLPHIIHSLSKSKLIIGDIELGQNVGIISESEFIATEHPNLQIISVNHLFKPVHTWVAVRKNTYLRNYIYQFLELLLPDLTRKIIEEEQNKN